MQKMNTSFYINPLTDFGFNRIFHNEMDKDLLMDFLNGILPEKDKIIDLSYHSPVSFGEMEGDRKAIFDIFCTNEKGGYFIVEMQRAKQPFFKDRTLYYASHPIQSQAPKGVWNFELKPVYVVCILDFIFFDETKEDRNHYLETVRLTRERTGSVFFDKMNFIYVELPKFVKTEAELETNADRWMFCLRNLSRLDSRPAAVQGRIFEKLFKKAEIKRLTTTEMKTYNKSILEYDDVRSAVDFAKEEAHEVGLNKGLKEGLNKGLMQGREEMKKAQQKTVLNCFKKGLSMKDISEITGLSISDIKQLKPRS